MRKEHFSFCKMLPKDTDELLSMDTMLKVTEMANFLSTRFVLRRPLAWLAITFAHETIEAPSCLEMWSVCKHSLRQSTITHQKTWQTFCLSNHELTTGRKH